MLDVFGHKASKTVFLITTASARFLRKYFPVLSTFACCIVSTDSKLNLGMPLSPSAADSYQQDCIRMTLENVDLWRSFHSIGTEMIITKHGRRMFPHCSISLSGLQPLANYVIIMEMVPVDNFKYKWKREQWEVAGKAEPQPPCRTYMHPDSPATGNHWMNQPLSFLKMKLTNNTLDQHGHVRWDPFPQ
uniref:T-box domain-containing protein n=1 Tax=Mastacembelus armatus TaxID=205130 RepID=A0A3Q3LID3_9TELE